MKKTEEICNNIIKNLIDGFAYCRIVTNVSGEAEDFVFLDVNPVFEKITGIHAYKVLQKKLTEAIPQIQKGEYNWIQRLGNVVLKEKEQTFVHFSDKLQKWLQIRAFCPERGHLALLITDVTGRQQPEQEIRKQNDQLKQQVTEKTAELDSSNRKIKEADAKYLDLADDINAMVYCANPETLQPKFVNKAVNKFYGFSKEEWLRNPGLWADSMHPDDRDKVLKYFEEAQKKKENGVIEYRIIRKDKSEIKVEDRFHWRLDSEGKVISLNGVIYDVTERKFPETAAEIPHENIEELIKQRAEALAKEMAEEIAKVRAEEIAKERAEEIAKVRAEEIAKERAEEIAKVRAEEIAKERAEELGNQRAEEITKERIAEYDKQRTEESAKERETEMQENKRAQEELHKTNALLHALIDGTRDPVYAKDLNNHYTFVNAAFSKITGKSIEEISGKDDNFLFPADEAVSLNDEDRKAITSGNTITQEENRTVAAGEKHAYLTVRSPLLNKEGNADGVIGIMHDITEWKKTDEAFKNQEYEINVHKKIENAVLTSLDDQLYHEVLKAILDSMQSRYGILGSVNENGDVTILSMMDHVHEKGVSSENTGELARNTWGKGIWLQVIQEKKTQYSNEISVPLPEGQSSILRNIVSPIIYRENLIGLLHVAHKESDYEKRDIELLEALSNYIAPILYMRTQHEIAQKARMQAEQAGAQLISIMDNMTDLVAIADMQGDIIYLNKAGNQMLEIEEQDSQESKRIAEIFPEKIKLQITDIVIPAILKDGTWKGESILINKSGHEIPVSIAGIAHKKSDGTSEHLSIIAQDISQHQKVNDDIARLNKELENKGAQIAVAYKELERFNKEFEQFAYSSFHELQEPCRMVTNFTQLLEKRYKGRFDNDADDFIYYGIEGSIRMQNIINDLLSYSQLTLHSKSFEPVDCEEAFKQACTNLTAAVESSNAEIVHDALPIVTGDNEQIVQLFQNLISNAIKFKRDDSPHVYIKTELKDDEWFFSIHDNGIGISPEYLERIFVIFQRLHGRKEYSGTGIGLANCKRIIERHGGKIWAESTPGSGSTFYFTIPKGGIISDAAKLANATD